MKISQNVEIKEKMIKILIICNENHREQKYKQLYTKQKYKIFINTYNYIWNICGRNIESHRKKQKRKKKKE